MLSLASSCPDTTKLVNVPFSPVAVVNVLLPLSTPFTLAVNVPVTPLYALLTTLVSIVPDVYLRAVVVCKLAPATNGFESELSVKPAVSRGLVPCVLSDKLNENVLKFDGALGTAFN